MGFSSNVSRLGLTGLLSLPLMAALTLLPSGSIAAQESAQPDGFDSMPPSGEGGETLTLPSNSDRSSPQPSVPVPSAKREPQSAAQPEAPEAIRPLASDSSLLSVETGMRLIEEAKLSAATEEYEQAVQKLQQSREIFNQLSNFHLQLYNSFAGIDNRIAEAQRRKAADTAEMRDRATYELALIHQAQNQPELAVPLFIQILGSQQPTRDLGKEAYEQLSAMGFIVKPAPTTPNAEGTEGAEGADVEPTEGSVETTDATSESPERPPSVLSIQTAQGLMEEARQLAAAEDYAVAIGKLQQAREIFNQLSNFHQQLYSSFTGIDNEVAASQRSLAGDTAEMRDMATYELALVHRVQNQPALAVPLLIQIVRSQQPTRELGKKAYQQLWELGFVESPYPAAGQNSPPSSFAQ